MMSKDAMWSCASCHDGYFGRNVQGRVIHDVDSRSKPTITMDEDDAYRRGGHGDVACIFPDTVSDLSVSALQYAKRVDDPDAAERRLFLFLEICLWLNALFAALFAPAVLRAHLR